MEKDFDKLRDRSVGLIRQKGGRVNKGGTVGSALISSISSSLRKVFLLQEYP